MLSSTTVAKLIVSRTTHFVCGFQSSWTNANKKQREKLLELIRRLAEDDKGGVMAHKVLMLFWNLAHSEDVPTEIMDQALNAHVKILDYSCSQVGAFALSIYICNKICNCHGWKIRK